MSQNSHFDHTYCSSLENKPKSVVLNIIQKDVTDHYRNKKLLKNEDLLKYSDILMKCNFINPREIMVASHLNKIISKIIAGLSVFSSSGSTLFSSNESNTKVFQDETHSTPANTDEILGLITNDDFQTQKTISDDGQSSETLSLDLSETAISNENNELQSKSAQEISSEPGIIYNMNYDSLEKDLFPINPEVSQHKTHWTANTDELLDLITNKYFQTQNNINNHGQSSETLSLDLFKNVISNENNESFKLNQNINNGYGWRTETQSIDLFETATSNENLNQKIRAESNQIFERQGNLSVSQSLLMSVETCATVENTSEVCGTLDLNNTDCVIIEDSFVATNSKSMGDQNCKATKCSSIYSSPMSISHSIPETNLSSPPGGVKHKMLLNNDCPLNKKMRTETDDTRTCATFGSFVDETVIADLSGPATTHESFQSKSSAELTPLTITFDGFNEEKTLEQIEYDMAKLNSNVLLSNIIAGLYPLGIKPDEITPTQTEVEIVENNIFRKDMRQTVRKSVPTENREKKKFQRVNLTPDMSDDVDHETFLERLRYFL